LVYRRGELAVEFPHEMTKEKTLLMHEVFAL
jgi:hypothetical protein